MKLEKSISECFTSFRKSGVSGLCVVVVSCGQNVYFLIRKQFAPRYYRYFGARDELHGENHNAALGAAYLYIQPGS